MDPHSLTHVPDSVLLRDLHAHAKNERGATVHVVSYIGEMDARRLYLSAGHPSMFAYCRAELHLSEDAAYKRIQAARVARRFPILIDMLADGRLHLCGVSLLAPHLMEENAEELIEAAIHKSKSEIAQILAQRLDVPPPTRRVPAIRALPTAPVRKLAPGQVGSPPDTDHLPDLLEGAAANTPAPTPAPQRFLLHVSIDKSTHDKLRRAQELLSHSVPSGDVATVLDRALDALITTLEKRKFAATERPRKEPRRSTRPRHIPASVRRAVRERDRDRCTFVSTSDRQCEEKRFLEFDHIDPVARGGRSTVENLRLRCRAHNRYEADRVYGAAYMNAKRQKLASPGRTVAFELPTGHCSRSSPPRCAAVPNARADVPER